MRPRIWAVLICLIAFTMLVYQLDEKSLWADEAQTAQIVQDGFGSVISALEQGHPHPPLYFLCLWAWTKVAGSSEFALRFPSVVFGLLSIAVLYALGTKMMGPRVGLMAMGLMSASSCSVLYLRMARYYSLVLLLSLISYWFFWCLLEGPQTRVEWTGYVAVSTLAVYTFYPAAFVLAAQGFIAFSRVGQRPGAVLRVFASQVVVLLLFSSWVPVMVHQANIMGAKMDDFGGSTLAISVLSTAYPFLAWLVGGSMYPWNPAALLGITLGVGLASKGVLSIIRRADDEAAAAMLSTWNTGPGNPQKQPLWRGLRPFLSSHASALLVFSLLPWLLTILTMRMFVAGDPLVANRAIFCMPFVYLLIAAGLWAISSSSWRLVALTSLAAVSGISLANYYTAREFHNPNYVLPSRAVVNTVLEESRPGDMFVSDYMTAFGYYVSKLDPEAAHFFPHELQEAKDYTRQHPAAGVWVILLCRAVETQSLARVELIPWLVDNGYSLDLNVGYVPLDGVYRRVQELVLRRPACEYKIMVHRYVRLEQGVRSAASQL